MDKINFGCRVTPELARRLRIKAAEDGISVQSILDQAIEGFMARNDGAVKIIPEKPESAYTGHNPEIDKWVRILVGILESGHPDAVPAILSNLVAFARLARIDLEANGAERKAQTNGLDIQRSARNLLRSGRRARGDNEDTQKGGSNPV